MKLINNKVYNNSHKIQKGVHITRYKSENFEYIDSEGEVHIIKDGIDIIQDTDTTEEDDFKANVLKEIYYYRKSKERKNWSRNENDNIKI